MSEKRLSRRDFLKSGAAAAAALAAGTKAKAAPRAPAASLASRRPPRQKILVLGFDGMDPHLVDVWMRQGKLPTFRKLASEGGYRRLATSIPPQSPVAWSNFIAGTNPGGHGIYDFIHRDPKSYFPVFSATETTEADKTVRIGNLVIPIKGGQVRNLRRGRAFWQVLEDGGIPATVFKMPANYPPVRTKQRTFSGLGTPDIYGNYNTFHFYTTESQAVNEDIGGGEIHQVYVIGNRVDAKIPGPVNTFRKDRPQPGIDLKVYLDPSSPVAKIVLPGREIILKEKEWSDWVRLRFPLIPTQSVSGVCRFYLKEVRPQFKLFLSSINIDPADAALPIATPPSYAEELARRFGPFYTKGLPAETQALDNGIFDEEEFLEQDDQVLAETRAIIDYELDRFETGFLFAYVSSTDQRQHMFWRLLDPRHPAFDEAIAARFGNVIERTYAEADSILASAMAKAGKETLVMVMSDHGFNPYARSFNLNTWLKEAGYHAFKNPFKREELELAFASTDWSKSKAYGLGLNGLYVNERGREAEGIVAAGAEKDNLVREIRRKLEEYRDPKTGEQVVLKAYAGKDVYSGAAAESAPDIVLGFNRRYRISFQSPLGRIPREIMEDNTAKWSGDHMGAAELLSGVLFANEPIKAEAPALYDVTATILDRFGIAKTPEMIGRTVL
ncbi:MAG: twin-arginine translocation signal domain-containing protein [Candidatus Aminicenantes bacterium]|nr:twin-arginine translocation signal domain-containing protein [Candidatus Aminicenantes bacterium]